MQTILAIDVMGGDHAPAAILDGVVEFSRIHPSIRFLLFGTGNVLEAGLQARPDLVSVCEARACERVVAMDVKPAQALRSGKGSSMWAAIEAVQTGEAAAVISAGNTGALMAMSLLILRPLPGVLRPAIACSWPTMKGRTVVLDVGAQVEADAAQLVEFAIMGDAFARSVHGVAHPKVGLLNIGSEDMKGRDEIREAARLIREGSFDFDFHGFVEGNDISYGTVDVVATDGFTGNIALKTAEGTAKLVASWVKQGLTANLLSKLGALLASSGLKTVKARMDPRTSNGGVFLGLKGSVVKAHGGSDSLAFSNALGVALAMTRGGYIEAVRSRLARFSPRLKQSLQPEMPEQTSALGV